jgi:hypothetical protein
MKSKDLAKLPLPKRRKGFSPRAFTSLKRMFGSIPSYRLSSRPELRISEGMRSEVEGPRRVAQATAILRMLRDDRAALPSFLA